MSASVYKQFLSMPSTSLLADDATLHYVTTGKNVHGAENIIKALNTIAKQTKKKGENILDEVSGGGASAFQIETIIKFLTSGGPYAPGMDDNFLADRTVNLLATHFVHYNAEGRIVQIRIAWDQAALLKQCEIIGKSGRNWPITDFVEQVRLVTKSVQNSGKAELSNDGNNSYKNPQPKQRSRGSSTLSLFRTREENENETMPQVASPYAGRRPPQRAFEDIVRDEYDSDGEKDRSRSRNRQADASRTEIANRLFNEDQGPPPSPPAHDRNAVRVKPDPSKYNHFDFQDFATPQKSIPARGGAARVQEAKHWDTDCLPETPANRKTQARPRRDAEKHFEIEDDGPMIERLNARPRGAGKNEGLGLYENHVYREDDSAPTPTPKEQVPHDMALRQKDVFQSKYKMTDAPGENTPQSSRFVPADRKKAVENMAPSWEVVDESPVPKKRGGIYTAGDGMGGRKGSEKKGDSSRGIRIGGDGMGGPAGTERDWIFGGGEEELKPKPKPKTRPHTQANDMWEF